MLFFAPKVKNVSVILHTGHGSLVTDTWILFIMSLRHHVIFKFLLILNSSFFILHSSLPVSAQNILTEPLKYAWAGGLNSCQFSTIDLNLDGINDLLVFDRHGNRKLTFINHGTPNIIDYSFSPEYANKLPEFHDWILTADFNCDGKEDIFTYSSGGIRVYKNVSDTVLKFQLVTNMLKSFYYTSYIGILVTSVDYPAIADIDDDGDLDILTFFGLGSYIEYHKNLSIENFGNCDSLDYHLTDHCWGKFKESEGGNLITLNVICPYKELTSDFVISPPANVPTPNARKEKTNGKHRHTGSTMLATDLNNDGVKDLILGDVDYPNLIALTNGGTKDSAFMTAVDTAFPSNSRPVKLFSFPSSAILDLDNDGINDLLVSPFDPNYFISENFTSVWFYKNTGSNSNPVFEFQTDHFLQGEMLDFGSISYPVLYDFNGDGLQDLFIGNYGFYDSSWYYQEVLHSSFTARITYFKNEGSGVTPMFRKVTDDLAGISNLNRKAVFPTFGDLNADGKPELIIGNSDSTLIYFENKGFTGDLPEFGPPQYDYQHIRRDVFNSPQLFDLNKDGMLDLILGGRNGRLAYFRNSGTASLPLFQHVTDSLGGINVTNYNISYDGFSTPFFFRDNSQTTNLVVGSEVGKIYYFTQIDNNLGGKFKESDSLFSLIGNKSDTFTDGWRSSAAMGHLSSSDLFDLVTGNFSGGLRYFSGTITPGIAEGKSENALSFSVYPNPANDFVNVEGPGAVSREPGAGSSRRLKVENINISDLFGQLILKIPFSGKITISVSKLPAGIYIIRCGSSAQKLIIHHF